MKQLIYPPLLVNLLMFIVGMVFGVDPNLVANNVVVSAPGGYVFQLQIGAIVFSLIAVAIAISFAGIRILGSGLSDTSVSIINRSVIYFLTWVVLSTVTFSFLSLVPTFGYLIYGCLSILYGFGVFLSLGEIGGTESPAQGTGGGSE